jgi:hypothetical protein
LGTTGPSSGTSSTDERRPFLGWNGGGIAGMDGFGLGNRGQLNVRPRFAGTGGGNEEREPE